MCGGSDVELGLMKIVGIFSKVHNKAVKSCPYRGCVLCSKGLGWVRCAPLKGEAFRECVRGSDVELGLVKIRGINEKVP